MAKDILITGASGFIGANLVRHTLLRGDRAHVFCRKNANMWRLKDVQKEIHIHAVDMRNGADVARAVGTIRPHVIYHFVSFGAYPFQADVTNMIQTNIGGTLALLQAARNVDRLEAVLSAGSSTEYGFKTEPMCEHDILEPNTAYGAAKASQTVWGQFFAKAYGLPVVIMRPPLVYGFFEESTRLIPSTIVAHVRRQPLRLSSPFPKKDFIFIDDILHASDILVTGAKQYAGEIFNIASGREYSVGEVVMLVRRLMRLTIPFKWGGHEGRIWDTETRWVDDVSKAKRVLGWHAKHTFEEGLAKTIRWFETYHTLYP
ncbi:MAG: nucleoside-diphosphate-sugar epimerase [Parcubacteria group bacterium Gr01-1014_29]|nr:MAG: nucleoside-diphosphate-sugar epimerase [Parcubacteria group bacterium Gr01-1014_29]